MNTKSKFLVYEIKLSKIDTIPSEKGLSGLELQNIAVDENDNSVTMYNISAAMPRVKVRNWLKHIKTKILAIPNGRRNLR